MRRGYSWCSPGTIHDRKSEKTGVQQCSIKYGCYLQLMILAWDSTLDSQARTDSMLVHGNDTSEWYRKFHERNTVYISIKPSKHWYAHQQHGLPAGAFSSCSPSLHADLTDTIRKKSEKIKTSDKF